MWMRRKIEVLAKSKKGAWDKYRQLGSSVPLKEFWELRSKQKRKSEGQKGDRR